MGDSRRKPWRDERILFSHMREEEIRTVEELLDDIRTLDDLTFIDHSMIRLYQRYIYEDEVFDTIKDGNIIEFHIVNNSPRVLIRKQRMKQSYDICVIVDIVTKTVVSAYLNQSNDKHKTLHEEIYNDDLDVCKIIKDCLKTKRRKGERLL